MREIIFLNEKDDATKRFEAGKISQENLTPEQQNKSSTIQKCRAKYAEYEKKTQKIYVLIDHSKNAIETEKNQDKLRSLTQEFDEFVCNEYARAVFEAYAHKAPDLIIVSTKETAAWNDVFGTNFEKLSKLRRFSLVHLIEGGGKYKLKK